MREGGRGGAQHTAARAGPHPAAPNFVSVEQPERSAAAPPPASARPAAVHGAGPQPRTGNPNSIML